MKEYYSKCDDGSGWYFDALVTDADYELSQKYHSTDDIPDDVYNEYIALHDAEIEQLTEYVIPDTYRGKPVVVIGQQAFTGGNKTLLQPEYVALKRIKVGKYVEVIDDGAFAHMPSLEQIDLPESLESMYDIVFNKSGTIKKLHLGKKFNFVTETSFRGVKILSFDVDPANEEFRAESGCLIDKSGTIIKGCPGAVLPDSGVVSIEEFAFEYAPVDDPVVPEGVKKIGKGAFYGQSFKQVTLPSTIKFIYNVAFAQCSSLEKIVYNGTMAQWKTVLKSGEGQKDAWNSNTGKYVVACTDGTIDSAGVEHKETPRKQGFFSKLKNFFGA